MVRFGQRQVQKESDEVRAEEIREQPQIPSGRFGRGLAQTEALQQRAFDLRRIRQEAIQEANRLESTFFGKNITIEQSQEAYEQVDPLVRQFIKTTPTVRRGIARETSQKIDSQIAQEKADIQRLRSEGKRLDDPQIQRKKFLIEELQGLKDEAATGAFRFGELLSSARERSSSLAQRGEQRGQFVEKLRTGGLTQAEAQNVLLTSKITTSQAQRLSPETRKAVGIDERRLQVRVTTLPAQELGGVRLLDTEAGTIKIVGPGAFEVPREQAIKQAFQTKEVRAPEFKTDKVTKRFNELQAKELRGDLTVLNRVELLALGVPSQQIKKAGQGFETSIKSFKNIKSTDVGRVIRNPAGESIKSIVNLGANIDKEAKKFGPKISQTPTIAFGEVAFEVAAFKGTQEILVRGPSLAASVGTRLTPSFRAAKTQQVIINQVKFDEKVIKNVAGVGDIGLIPPGSPSIPRSVTLSEVPATVRGGFGFKAEEQARFIGVKGLATSQRGFLPKIGKTTEIREVEKGFGLFATPADPVTKRLQTRISRLGETPRTAKFSEILEGEVTLGSTPKPQILVFKKEVVGRRGGFEIMTQRNVAGKGTSELEAITRSPRLGGPSLVKKTKKLGTTVIGGPLGARVPIIEVELSKSAASGISASTLKKLNVGASLSKSEIKSLSRATGFKESQFIKDTGRISPTGLIGQTTRTRTRKTPSMKSIKIPTIPSIKISPRKSSIPTNRTNISRSNTRLSVPRGKSLPTINLKRTGASPNITRFGRTSLTRTPTRPPARPPTRPPMRPSGIPLPRLEPRRKPSKLFKREASRSDIFISESFTARSLKLKPLKIPQSKISESIPKYQSIGIRLRPIIIPDINTRRRKKKR